jgi:hypothetical protein
MLWPEAEKKGAGASPSDSRRTHTDQMQNILYFDKLDQTRQSQMQNRLDFIGHSRPGLCTTPLYMLAVALSG